MKANADLTIYARSINAATRSETWARSVVHGVTWEDRRAANVLKSGNLEADRIAVYIPMARGEISLHAGDVIVRGVVTDAIGAGFTISDLFTKYSWNAATVRSVDKMDRGSLAIRHWQIGAS